MKPYRLLQTFLIFVLPILLINCKKSTKSESDWGTADFTSFVAIGNSLTAGVADGALYEDAQKNSFPKLIANAAGINDFEQPLMGGNGYSFNENEGRLSLNIFVKPPSIDFLVPAGPEKNRNLNRAYNNLGIPLIRANQVHNVKTSVEADSNHFVDKILRNSGRTQIQEALTLDPTLITLWVGNNDVLEAASLGLADSDFPYTDPEDFEDDLTDIILELTIGTDAPILIANIFDLTDLPYFSSLPSEITFMETNKYLFGECEEGVRELTDDDLILFWALPDYLTFKDSTEFPGNISDNTALNDTLILDKTEKEKIQDVIDVYNDIIQTLANQNDQLYLVDVYSLFKSIANNGYDFGGINYSNDLISFDENGVITINLLNTLFSYDGLHPNQNGYLAIANAFIDKINSVFNANLPSAKIN